MKRAFLSSLFALLVAFYTTANAQTAVGMFEIEGLISPASPKALISELEAQLGVTVTDLNLKNTESGWPVLTVEFDSGKVSLENIEQTIGRIEDPAGHKYRVRVGPPNSNTAYTDEEIVAIAALGPGLPDIVPVSNPVAVTEESVMSGKSLFEEHCTTCHGLNGNGQGPAAHGIMTFPRQLWVWNNAPASADDYLYWFITNGRNEMPPWGVILSENDRWDVINYIKTLTKPE